MPTIDELKIESREDLSIDTLNLDSESLRTPKLYGKWLEYYHEEIQILDELVRIEKRLKRTLQVYYSGKASEDAYKKKPLHHVYLKTEIDDVINANEDWIKFKEKYDDQKSKVDYIEKVMKQISNRGFSISAAIEWRKFQDGR